MEAASLQSSVLQDPSGCFLLFVLVDLDIGSAGFTVSKLGAGDSTVSELAAIGATVSELVAVDSTSSELTIDGCTVDSVSTVCSEVGGFTDAELRDDFDAIAFGGVTVFVSRNKSKGSNHIKQGITIVGCICIHLN